MQLDPSAAAAGVGLVTFDAVSSTNAEALQIARAGGRTPQWVVARRQTAGRGRRGRTWVSEPGNLYASLLLIDPSPMDRAAELSLVAGLALHDAIAGRVPGLAARLKLKWPNVLLIDRNKLAGILFEGVGSAVIIGIGENCIHHPSGTQYPATDLAAAGVRATPEGVFAALSGAMVSRLAQWDRGAGFDAIREDWMARAAGLGRAIRISLPDGERLGHFETVDPAGRLVLRNADGTLEAFAAGDVDLARP
jgi:BirA family biotin operon repressor/biotin-[acetyl-CoA-carboxylase] ligase